MDMINKIWDDTRKEPMIEYIIHDETGTLLDIPEILGITIQDLYSINETNNIKWIQLVEQKIREVRKQEQEFHENLKSQNTNIEERTIIEKQMINKKRILAQIQSIFSNQTYYQTYLKEYSKFDATVLPSKNVNRIKEEQENRKFPDPPLAKELPRKTEIVATVLEEVPVSAKIETPKKLEFIPIGTFTPAPIDMSYYGDIMIDLKENKNGKMYKRKLAVRKKELEQTILPSIKTFDDAILRLTKELSTNDDPKKTLNLSLITIAREKYLRQNESILLQIREYRNIIKDLNRISKEVPDEIVDCDIEESKRAL